jgi:hypothetical protein
MSQFRPTRKRIEVSVESGRIIHELQSLSQNKLAERTRILRLRFQQSKTTAFDSSQTGE